MQGDRALRAPFIEADTDNDGRLTQAQFMRTLDKVYSSGGSGAMLNHADRQEVWKYYHCAEHGKNSKSNTIAYRPVLDHSRAFDSSVAPWRQVSLDASELRPTPAALARTYTSSYKSMQNPDPNKEVCPTPRTVRNKMLSSTARNRRKVPLSVCMVHLPTKAHP